MNIPSKVEIWKVNLRATKGHEQERERPAAVWKHLDHVEMAIVIPFTTSPTAEKFPYTHCITPNSKNGLAEESIAMVFQIRAIDKGRLTKKLGELEEKNIAAIAEILRDMLKL